MNRIALWVLPLTLTALVGADAVAASKHHTPIEVVAVASDADPIVNLRVVFRAGSRDDPAGKEGLTSLSAHLMSEATRSHDAAALKQALFPWAAELGVQVDKETTAFIGRVHQDHLWRFLSLYLQMLQAPRLDQGDFERVKEQHLNRVERKLRSADDELLVREALETQLYDRGDVRHPYRHTPAGTVAGLKSITLDDVRAHIMRTFTRDRVILGLSGGFEPGHQDLLSAALSALPLGKGPRPALPPAPAIDKTSVLLVDKEAPGSAISVGFHVELDRHHPDYAAMKLAETFFGEHRNRVGWLFNAMREVRGLNYGDYAYIEHFVQQGWSTLEQLNIGREQQYFSMWIRPVEHDKRHFALRQAVWELSRFVDRGIPSDEKLDEIKAFVAGYWQSKEQEPMRRLGYLVDDQFHGQPGARDALKQKVASLTLDEVNAAIKRHLRPDRLRVVVVTKDAAPLKAALVANTPSPIPYPAPPPAWVLEEDKAIMVHDLDVEDGDVRVIGPDALFER
jgi:zinc protease